DDKKSIIIRVYETEGIKTNVRMQLPLKIKSAESIDFNGNIIKPLEIIQGHSLQMEIGQFKILTLRIYF
ncbi:MAG: glycosyl hydrolase-related protein, partial [Nitrososphaeraceae archaeon]